ncbi:MAG: TIGR02452 family protein [Clostridiales bacterium]|nr:TIGR02452 family protein [Clostridiales bacterium]MCC8106405.1 TIGR02452 family protein [Clostridiales bacterium]
MADFKTGKELSEEERMKQMAAQMRAAEYKGLSEEEIQERERLKEMRRKKNIEILEDTLEILGNGSFEKDGQEIKLQFSPEQMREMQVFLPEDIDTLRAEKTDVPAADGAGSEKNRAPQKTGCTFGCENIDALVLAQKKYLELKGNGDSAPKVLVLNLASSTHPGGQTRKGASAQEEDLCRRTSLLFSLESDEAKKYYDYNNARKTHMGSDGVMISPCVEVLKGSSSETLSEPFPISVMSCAAPMIRLGLEGMSRQEYEGMLCQRIQGMLLTAASQNYRHLILGAFGCGVFGNDAAVVSNLFHHAIQDLSFDGRGSDQLFDSIDFAVLCRPGKDYNYKEFCRNFSQKKDSCVARSNV